MRILILEDDPARLTLMREALDHVSGLEIVHVEKASEAIEKLSSEVFDVVTLDHDLGGQQMVKSGPGTGYEVACWLENNPDAHRGQTWIHSLNPVGRYKMSQALPEALVVPGWWNR